jgi:HEAT repeat protein
MTMLRLITILAMLLTIPLSAQTTHSADDKLDFGEEGMTFPPTVIVNGHTDRTAQLLGEAYRRKEPLVWKRAQLIAELGRVALPAGAPCVKEAMKEESGQVRAEAARAAAAINDAALRAEARRLLQDPDAAVRREAVLATHAIEEALSDKDPAVVAAALQSADAKDAKLIAAAFAALPDSLKSDAALALGRLKATEHSSLLLPLLQGDVVQRASALRALAQLGDKSRAEAVAPLLNDAHPTVRRTALSAYAALADATSVRTRAIAMLADADFAVRATAASVLAPLPSTQALNALVPQLEIDYAPLHEAVRQTLAHPIDAGIRASTIDAAAKMLADANPRRREDASYVLGRLKSDAAIDRHLALLRWDAKEPAKTDWPLVAQAAESLGMIGNAAAAAPLMELVKPAPDSAAGLPPEQGTQMVGAFGNAMIALGRLHHQPALAQAIRIVQIDPQGCPPRIRAGAAFAIGMLDKGGNGAQHLPAMYQSTYEDAHTKFEALKALGNLAHAPSTAFLKRVTELEPDERLRWIAHWSYERCSNRTEAYIPPARRDAPPVSIMDLGK